MNNRCFGDQSETDRTKFHTRRLAEVLREQGEFINKNGHLPDVPSAEDVSSQGQDLGRMDAILLRKIEELTLYIIELEKRLNEKNEEK